MKKDPQIIYETINANEIFAKTQIIQTFLNDYNFPLEIKIEIPLLNDYRLIKFNIKLDDQMIISKILEKEKGKEKYTDEISSGNIAFLGNVFDSGEKMIINIGNLFPKKTIELMTEYIQFIQSEDMSYCLNVIQSYPKLVLDNIKNENNIFSQYYYRGIKCNINISTNNHLTRFIILNKRKDISYNTEVYDNLTFAKVSFNSKNLENKNMNSYKYKTLSYFPLKIIFRTENMNIPILYSQYDNIKNETSYIMHYMFKEKEILSNFTKLIMNMEIDENRQKLENYDILNFVDMDNNINYYQKYFNENNVSYPSCYIFLIDQSGSMTGIPIQILKKTIILFIKSLPFNSYFQIYGFGTNYIKYNEIPLIYNEKNVNEIIDILLNINADLGGTNLLNPLKEIFENKKLYIEVNLPIHLIIITDGKVKNAGKCANIIYENKNIFKTHAIGIGDDYDKSLIEQCANSGRGIKSFINDVNYIFYPIFNILNLTSRKYLKDLDIEIINGNEHFQNIKYDILPYNNSINEDDFIIKGFICLGKPINKINNESIKIITKYKDSGEKNLSKKENDINRIQNLNDGDDLSKLIIGSLIDENDLNKNLSNEEIVKLSKEYGVLSTLTCFFGSIENEFKITNKLINISNIYIANNINSNFSYPKTGKHGHAKKIRINTEEDKLNEFFVDNREQKLYENLNIKLNDNDFNIVNDIIQHQDIERGYWNKIFFDNKLYKDIYQKILDFYKNKGIKENEYLLVCKTIMAIYYLNDKFKIYEIIWKQAANKGIFYLSENNVNYDKTLEIIKNKL